MADLVDRRSRVAYGFLKALQEDPNDKIAPEPKGIIPSESFCGKLVPTEDQGATGRCAPFACASLLTHIGVKADGVVRNYSKNFLYARYRQRMGIPLSMDPGSFLFELAQTAVETGLVTEEMWDDSPANLSTEPPKELDVEAEKNQALIPVRLVSTKMCKASLSMGWPFFAGVLYPKNGASDHAFMTGEILANDGLPPLGPHAMLWLGHNDNKQLSNGHVGAWRVLQSWGPGFGEDGLGWLDDRIPLFDARSFRAIEVPA